MAIGTILQRSKKSILGLDVQLANIETNIANNATGLSSEITRASGAESGLQGQINTEKGRVNILNADINTTGSVKKQIADAVITKADVTTTYTKTEVDAIAATKLDSLLVLSTVSTGNKLVTQTELNLKANTSDVYSKTEMDVTLAGKADASNSYTKTEIDTSLASKADISTTYTKTETNALISPKANSADVYTKTEVDTALTTKLNTSDTITTVTAGNKIVTQTELASKANVSDVYTQTQIDTSLSTKLNTTDALTAVSAGNKLVTQTELSTKANTTDVYTKTQIDTSLSGKASVSTQGKVGPSLKVVDETNIADGKVISYNSTTGNLEYVSQIDTGALINDTATNGTETWSSTKISSELTTKANSADVYTKVETDAVVATAAKGIKYSVADMTALAALTGMNQDDQAVVESTRAVYKYDTTTGWTSFYQLDGSHNHDDLYFTKAQVTTSLATKANTADVYTKTQIDTSLATKANSADIGKVGPSLVIVDETNKVDGNVLSFNNSTGQLEYVPQSAGSLINDSTTTSTNVWSSTKTNSELSLKANSADVYTKTASDTALAGKVNVSDVKSTITGSNKVVTEAETALKADVATTYTKSEVDTITNAKVNTSDVKSAITTTNKVVTETDIAGKADASSVYTKSEVDTSLATKANSSDVYTKSQIDTSLTSKLNTSDTVTAVSGTNKVVTQNEISGLAPISTTYTKTEVDALVTPKFDNTVAKSAVSAGNKLVTETELATTLKTTDAKTAVSGTNKLMTESDVTTVITAATASTPTAPVLVVDRPTLSLKSSTGLNYTYQFALSKIPHGTVVVNDEITIYNYHVAGDAITFENVSVFADKHGEITATLGTVADDALYLGKTIKVCYLTTEPAPIAAPTPVIGTASSNPLIINVATNFELPTTVTTQSYNIDFSTGSFFKIVFADGYYATVAHDVTKTGFWATNTTDYQVTMYTPSNVVQSLSWIGTVDETQYLLYNWFMSFTLVSGTTYKVTFDQGISVGGGSF